MGTMLARGRRFAGVSYQCAMRILICLMAACLACAADSDTPPQPRITFDLTLFDGRQLDSGTMRGKTLVVNFWASWCKPCLEEAPDLRRVWRAYQQQDVVFVGIVFKDDHAAAARTFLRNARVDYPNGQDVDGELASTFQIVGLPNTFIVDREGRLAHRFIGPVKAERLSALLDQTLTRQPRRRQHDRM